MSLLQELKDLKMTASGVTYESNYTDFINELKAKIEASPANLEYSITMANGECANYIINCLKIEGISHRLNCNGVNDYEIVVIIP